MEKSKKQNGITLIALIITIVVLLILAMVAIGAVQNDGIIEYAKNARSKYETAETNEQTTLSNYLSKLEENNPNQSESEDEEDKETPVLLSGPWTQNNTVLTNENGDTINVGERVEYDETKGGTVEVPVDTSWKVLGAENGKILLMSRTNVEQVELYGCADSHDDAGIVELNAACEGYNKGTGADEETKSRSIKKEDIDKIIGFPDPDGAIYYMIFERSSYWLASTSYSTYYTGSYEVIYDLVKQYGMHYVDLRDECVSSCVLCEEEYNSDNHFDYFNDGEATSMGVRAVVSLDSSVKLRKNEENREEIGSWESYLWEIVE